MSNQFLNFAKALEQTITGHNLLLDHRRKKLSLCKTLRSETRRLDRRRHSMDISKRMMAGYDGRGPPALSKNCISQLGIDFDEQKHLFDPIRSEVYHAASE